MTSRCLLMVGLLVSAIAAQTVGTDPTRHALAREIGFVEDFALASDRTVPLAQLIPGTEDYYYYHCLHYQNTEQYQRVEETLKAWIKRYKYTTRVHEIMNRQALLTFPQNPQKTLAHLQHRLGLRFDHQRQLLDRKPNLPTRLHQDLISRQTLTKRALARHKNLQGFEPTAHDWLIVTELNADRQRHLLSQLQRPDHGNLPQRVVNDLNYRHSRGFGSFPIHGQLLLSQLKACLQLKPDLLNQGNFVNTYLVRLQPGPDVDWRNDPAAYEAYLDRLWAFVKRLAPVHNSLKAHVLYHRLVHDRGQDVYDADRFLAYLKLPRPLPYVEPRYLQREESRRYRCNLNADFRSVTMLPPVGNDETLVRSHLMHFFVAAANYDDYRPFVRDDYLKHAFAETKIVNGLGDPEQWYSLLPPAVYQQLKERVDLDFAHTSRKLYAPDEPVSLDLFVKNVETLIVKVFEINTGNFYRDQQREIDTDVNLDGLVANHEKTHTYSEPPLRRVRRHFEFPELNRRGVYVIDFIGNGKSSRALIRKGRLRHLVRTSTAGHVFTVLDQQNQILSDAKLWLAGREYTPDKQGLITVPFSNQPQRQTIVLTQGDFSSIDAFDHQSEKYELQAAIFVDRESLISRRTSRVLIRPSLRVSGVPVAPSVLEEVKLRITSTDQDGVSTSQEIADFPLHVDQESTHDFQVPQRLASLSFQLSAKVQNLSQNKKIDLSARQEFVLNQIDRQANTAGLHFQQIDGAYAIDVLGKSGEPLADRPVLLTVKHRDFRQPVHVSLQSGPRGRVALGRLEDIVWVKATGPAGTSYTWNLRHDAHTYPATVDARVGETVALPYMGPEAGPRRDQLSLLELRGETFVADWFQALDIKNGMLQIRDLPAGDYDLLIKRSGTWIRIRLAEGSDRERYVLGSYRLLERRGDRPLQIENIKVGEKDVTVKLRNANKATRLHVFAVRYEPAYAPFGYLGRIRDVGPAMRILPAQPSQYIAGRNIGDEYRYIIDRKYAKKYPGNMLTRPSLLLNPWSIRSTEAGAQQAQERRGFRSGGARYGGKAGRRAAGAAAEAASTDFGSLDFLDQGAAVLVNLRPDEAGVIRIDRELIGPHQKLQFVAVDPLSTTYRSLSLPEVPRKLVDLRLIVGLDPAKHFTQQKQITLVDAKQTLEVADITSTRLEPYDSLARVYALYMTLSKDSKLAEFAFVMNWHKLKAEEKRKLYSEYACHELNFFLMKKDPAFFREAIVPYLKNKKDKTFLDQWLLEEKLDKYLLPWNHAGLNIVERILLGQRIAGERPRTARHVTDLYDLIPPDLTRFNYLFNTAVQGRQLQVGGQLGWDKAVKEALGRRQREAREKGNLGDLLANGISSRDTRDTDEAAPDVATSPLPPGAAFGGKPGDRPRKAAEKAAAKVDMPDLEEEIEEVMEDVVTEFYFEGDAKRRAGVRRLYIKLDKTQEWVENNYYKLPIAQQNAELVTVNSFWNDFAAHDPGQPFYSTNLAEASRNFTEMMFALALLDLPLEGEPPKMEFADARMKLTAASPLIVFHEQVLPSAEIADETPILVSQNFFRHGDRYRHEGNQRLDKYVTDEFLVHTVYGCQVVVTNPTSTPRKLDVLLQIPVGAMPVLGGQATRSVQLDLQPYQTQSLEYHFYFPKAGEFAHYPVHVSQDERLLAFAPPVTLNVVRKLSRIDRESWDYISQNGTNEDVIKYLQANNVNRIQLDRIAWRMHDEAFFKKVVRLLAARHVYNHTLWSYAVKHGHVRAIREYLQHADDFVQQCGSYLVSPLLVIDPVVRKTYEHIDYRPLVNARAHQLGRRRQILNDQLYQQYHRLLKLLSYRRGLNDDQLMAVTYYMLLQDRVEEALGFFQRVNANRLATLLQYDYLSAYLDLYRQQPDLARSLAAKYASHPVDRWRRAFENVAAQLEEIEGEPVEIVDKEDRQQQQTQLAATAPAFDFRVESRKVILNHQNLAAVKVNYYLMDIELLFSGNPFVQEYGGQFSYIRPNLTQQIELEEAAKTTTFELPAQLHTSNVLVEIRGGGRTKAKAYYANSLDVQVVQDYGQLRVTHAETHQPLPKVYVKVYARNRDGGVKFYKDGYTDLRGRFDFTSLNTNELDFVGRFSLLVLSEDHGAIVRNAKPPQR